MIKRLVSGIMLTLLLMGIFTLAFDIQHVESSQPPSTEWNRTYGGAGDDVAHSVVQTSDGGYALAGQTTSHGAKVADFWLVKTDERGNMVWNRTYGGAGDDVAHSVIQTSDGGYALAGQTNSYSALGNWQFWLVKTDASGNIVWNQTYMEGSGHPYAAYSVVQTSDGGYATAGYVYIPPPMIPYQYDCYMVKTNATGGWEWSGDYTPAYGRNEKAYSMIQTSDGGYALAGYSDNTWPIADGFYLVRTDSVGFMQWSKRYDVGQEAYSVVQTSDGGYALAGYGYGNVRLVKTDANGTMVWTQTYGGTGDDLAYSVVQTSDGGYALAGYTTSYGAGGADFWLVKVAPDIHDLTVLNVTPFKTVIGQNYSISINVTVENQGNNDENFTLNAYANTTIIDDEYIALTSGDSTIVTLTWNTTGFAYGNYTISAVADTVPGETDTADNTCINGTVFVTIPGDVDGDGDVDPADFYTFSGAYGTSPPSNPNCDIDNDGDVDPGDFYIFSGNYGKSV